MHLKLSRQTRKFLSIKAAYYTVKIREEIRWQHTLLMLRVTTLRKPTCLSPLDQNIAGNESVNAMTNHTTSQCDFCVRSVRKNIEICLGGGGGGRG